MLADRGILYTPDYVANAGGLVQVADEALNPGGFRFDRAKAGRPASTTRRWRSSGSPTARASRPRVAADRLAERRMADVGRLRSVLVPGRS